MLERFLERIALSPNKENMVLKGGMLMHKTSDYWREAHWDFFSKECAELGVSPCEDMLLVLERFEVVYK